MGDQRSPLNWPYFYYQEEAIEEIKHSLLYNTLELEATILSAHEELARKEDELMHLKCLLTKTMKERDEAQATCQSLALDKLLLQQQLQQPQKLAAAPLILTTTTSNEDETFIGGDSNTVFSSSGWEENVVPSPPSPPPARGQEVTGKLVAERALPEKGKFLQAVMEAGPLLQTLLLAGPLPQWQHPPPKLDSIDIPPVTISSSSLSSPTPRLVHQDSCASTCFSRKRGNSLVYCEASDSSPKNQKVVYQSSFTHL